MDTKEMDRLFDDIDEEYLLTYLPQEMSFEEIYNLSDEETESLSKEIFSNIMSQIESDDNLYEYFTSKKEINMDMYINLLSKSKKHIKDIYRTFEETDLSIEQKRTLIESFEPEKAKNI